MDIETRTAFAQGRQTAPRPHRRHRDEAGVAPNNILASQVTVPETGVTRRMAGISLKDDHGEPPACLESSPRRVDGVATHPLNCREALRRHVTSGKVWITIESHRERPLDRIRPKSGSSQPRHTLGPKWQPLRAQMVHAGPEDRIASPGRTPMKTADLVREIRNDLDQTEKGSCRGKSFISDSRGA
jgi:hypothetical protein